MKVIYFSSMIEPRQFEYLRDKWGIGFGLQQQKFHECVVDGLYRNNMNVEVVSHFQITRKQTKQFFIKINKEIKDTVRYREIKRINIPIIGNLLSVVNMCVIGNKCAKKNDVIIADYLNIASLMSAYMVSEIKKINLYLIVTDLPYFYNENRKPNIIEKIQLFVLKKSAGCIHIIEDMSKVEEFKNIPYIVYEGSTNIMFNTELKEKENTIVYTGNVDRDNGIDILLEAWSKHSGETSLELFGKCEDRTLIDKMNMLPNVHWHGAVDNKICVEYQGKAMALVNPRLIKHNYNKYSFPSKMIEYLSSGTAVISTPIYCLKQNDEYNDKIIFTENDSVESWCHMLEKIRNEQESLLNYGLLAQKFMIENKNTKIQLEKVLHFIKKQEEKRHQR